jgi:hypothetical protein
MNATPVRTNDKSKRAIGQPTIVRRRASGPVKVEIGTGAIAPKVAIVRRKASAPVKVEIGTGAIAPKVAILRGKGSLSR